MAKVYLSPPYHYYNPCAVEGCDENLHNNRYLDELEVYLTACGIQFRRGERRAARSAGDGDEMMRRAVRESDKWGADVHYVSHTNAAAGKTRGCRPMIYPTSTEGKKVAECVMAERRKIYDGPITLVRRSDLYELYEPRAASLYEEHVFHDNSEDARWFHDHLRLVAESTARGLCAYFGLSFVDPYAAAPVALPVLRRGMESDTVRAAMAVLRDGGWYSKTLAKGDRVFGPEMEAAVKRLQKARGLDADGIVGEQTWPAVLGMR